MPLETNMYNFSFRYRCSGPRKKQLRKFKEFIKNINKLKLISKRSQRILSPYREEKLKIVRENNK